MCVCVVDCVYQLVVCEGSVPQPVCLWGEGLSICVWEGSVYLAVSVWAFNFACGEDYLRVGEGRVCYV